MGKTLAQWSTKERVYRLIQKSNLKFSNRSDINGIESKRSYKLLLVFLPPCPFKFPSTNEKPYAFLKQSTPQFVT